MLPNRPDLSKVEREIREYIEALELMINQNIHLQHPTPVVINDAFPPEPPGTIQVITISRAGIAKRTPRYLYSRQHRGGMGIFDIELSEPDLPAIITIADLEDTLILFTNHARAFRLPVVNITEGQIRSRGQSILSRISLAEGETFAAAVPFRAAGAIALVSQNGMIRHLRHHIFGEHMKAGVNMFPSSQFGQLAAACLTPGDSDIFIATEQGRAIRFSEKLISPQGNLAIRIDPGGKVTGIASVHPEDGVLLVDSEGRGAIRLMSGFAPNKSLGGGGKIAMNTDCVIGSLSTHDKTEAFIISRLSKVIRFGLDEIPQKENPVQGVNIMMLRSDEISAIALT